MNVRRYESMKARKLTGLLLKLVLVVECSGVFSTSPVAIEALALLACVQYWY